MENCASARFDPFWIRPSLMSRAIILATHRRDGRVVEGARLESVYRGNSIQGSNPCLSAIHFAAQSIFPLSPGDNSEAAEPVPLAMARSD